MPNLACFIRVGVPHMKMTEEWLGRKEAETRSREDFISHISTGELEGWEIESP